MIFTSEVDLRNNFAEITLLIEERTKVALSGAALEGTAKANEAAGKYTDFHYVPVHEIPGGFESGTVAENRLMGSIYNKGTLGKRRGKLKQPGRAKQTWTVKQRNRTYTAHRRDVAGKGVEGTFWASKAKRAGDKVIKAELAKL